MNKLVAIILTITILLLTVYNDGLTVKAADSEDTNAAYASSAVLTWEILEAYLYALVGAQAADVYENDENAQYNLFSDFCDWYETAQQQNKVAFVVALDNGVRFTANLGAVINYCRTDGTSALADSKEEIAAKFKVITGGKKNDENISPTPKPTSTPLISGDRVQKILGIGALTATIGYYIKELVDGNRGDVSNFFSGSSGIPDLYFNGEYKFDVDGNPLFLSTSHVIGPSYTVISGQRLYMYNNVYSHIDFTSENARFALCSDYTYSMDNIEYTKLRMYAWDVEKQEKNALGDYFQSVDYGKLPNEILYIKSDELANLSYIPVFNNQTSMLLYFEDGDCSLALNYFNANVTKPSDWLSYDISAIAQQLSKVLASFATLPVITTDMLTGFAQGVQNGVVAGALPQADPATQLDTMQRLLDENARKAAQNYVADTSMKSDDDFEDYFDDDGNLKPTQTPEEEKKNNSAKMVVDLHKFFPFCVPYDLVHLIKVLRADPISPKFETALKYDKLKINIPIKLDLSSFDEQARIFRILETILFILSLILVSRTLIRG